MPPTHRYSEHRWPMAPVVARFGGSARFTAAVTGYTPRSINRWLVAGVPTSTADELAVRHVGCHPCELWPDWFDVAALEGATRPMSKRMTRALAYLFYGIPIPPSMSRDVDTLRNAGVID